MPYAADVVDSQREDVPIDEEFAELDLADLDLDHIELEIEKPKGQLGRWLGLAVILVATVFIFWFPTTSYYRLQGSKSWPFFLLTSLATVVGIFGGRFLWTWAQEASERWARTRVARPAREPRPPSKAARWVLLLLGCGGAAFLIFGVSRQQVAGGGRGFSGAWFAAAGGAVVVGIVLGRWLLAQEHNPFKPRGEVKPLRLPPWFKWVTLTVLLATAGVAMFGMQLFPGARAESLRFSLGAVAFVVGVLAAIWLARRFEELEKRLGTAKTPGSARQDQPHKP